ncbi:MAG: hypothetical protein QM589_01060 [Thermomicrobiales bacterium]
MALLTPTWSVAATGDASPVVGDTPVETEPAPIETTEPTDPNPVETVVETEPVSLPPEVTDPTAPATLQPTLTATQEEDFSAAAVPITTLSIDPSAGTLPNSGSTTWTVSFAGQADSTPTTLQVKFSHSWTASLDSVSFTCTISSGGSCGTVRVISLESVMQTITVSGDFSGTLTITLPNPTANGRYVAGAQIYDQGNLVIQWTDAEFFVGPSTAQVTITDLEIYPIPGTLSPNGSTRWTLYFAGETGATPGSR